MSQFSVNRRHFLKMLGAGAVSFLTPGCMAVINQAIGKERPNFVFMIADDVSWNDFGCYGNPYIRTPNIDKLAKKGVCFTNAYLTAASCSPSRCSIITGRYPHNNGPAAELHGPLPHHLALFPKLLKESGYYTAHAGKWHIGSNKAYVTADMPAVEAFDISGGGLNTDVLTAAEYERMLQRLKDRPKDKPFFMWFAPHDAHRSFDADHIDNPHKPEEVVVPPYLADTPETRKDLTSHYNEVSRFDFNVGRIMEELERQSVADNTIFMVMSDNGRPFPRCKTRVYDSGMKTPMVVHWPAGISKAGSVCNSLVNVIDIAPTFLGLAGLTAAKTMQGRSFATLLKNPDAPFRNYSFSEHNWHDSQAHCRQVRWKRYMYIRNAWPDMPMLESWDTIWGTPSGRDLISLRNEGKLTSAQSPLFKLPQPAEQLYDCVKDPHQINDLAENTRYANIVKKLRAIMDQWTQETGDTVPEDPMRNWFDTEAADKKKQYIPTADFGKFRTAPGIERNAQFINVPGPF